MKKKATLKDIALLAGVSMGTVDRVINNRGNVAAEVEENIWAIAKSIGYEKNILASRLASNKTYAVAIVMPDPSSDLYWELPMRGIMKALQNFNHLGIIVQYYNYDLYNKQHFSIQLHASLDSKPDALLFSPIYYEESIEVLKNKNSESTAIFTINTEISNPSILSYVGQDSYQSGFLAGKLFAMKLPEGSTVAVVNLGQSIKEAKHYADKLQGLKDHFYFNNKSIDVLYYELKDFSIPNNIKNLFQHVLKNQTLKGIYFTNSRAYKLLDEMHSEDLAGLMTIGYDLITPNIYHLKNGKLDVVINQNPLMQGYMAVTLMVDHLIYQKKIKAHVYLPMEIMLKENIDYYLESDNIQGGVANYMIPKS